MTYTIKHLFHINAPKEKVFKAISTIDGLANWWTTRATGNTELGGVIQFRFVGDMGADMKVVEIRPNESITWECVHSQGWDGHIFKFELDENEGKTRLRFSQSGWEEQGDFYAHCCFSWGRYMESLRQLFCQTGKGEAFGSEGYKS